MMATDSDNKAGGRLWRTLLVAVILAIHAILLARIASIQAPMYDEIAHLPAGISHWQLGTFDLYRVNPPLVRLIAAWPAMVVGAKTDWSGIDDRPYKRPEFAAGKRFIKLNGERSLELFVLARWVCIPFSLLAASICYCWASELYGFASGLVALVLWCFCPNCLAWGATMMPDAAAAALGVTAAYCFWRWLGRPTWTRAIVAGVTLGLAELTKSTWILLFGIWPVLWLVTRVIWPPPNRRSARWNEASQLVTLLLLGLYLLNLGYGFEGSFRRLGKFDFVSATLGGQPREQIMGNRFRDTLWEALPVPLPANYVRGIDVQKYDFEIGRWSYLRGEQKLGGWYHYYAYALAVKTPLGALFLSVLAAGLAVASSQYRRPWRDEWIVLTPAIAILVLVSSQTGFNRYLRYVLPALPFLYIAVSRVGQQLQHPRAAQFMNPVPIITIVLLAASVVDSLMVYPNSMSYFNAFAGGPLGGPAHLLDANVDWGQDLLQLKTWLDAHPEARPIHLKYFGYFDPKVIGIEALCVPPGPPVDTEPAAQDNPSNPNRVAPRPGWYAVSVNDFYGYRHYSKPNWQYGYFRSLSPVARAGYSIYIYQLSQDDTDRLSREWQRESPGDRPVPGDL